MAVVKAIEANDTITLDQIAVVLGKSRSTTHMIFFDLREGDVKGSTSNKARRQRLTITTINERNLSLKKPPGAATLVTPDALYIVLLRV